MKFSAIVQETYTAAGEFKWYWNVFPVGSPDDFIEGTTPGRVSAKIAAENAARMYKIDNAPETEEWEFEL